MHLEMLGHLFSDEFAQRGSDELDKGLFKVGHGPHVATAPASASLAEGHDAAMYLADDLDPDEDVAFGEIQHDHRPLVLADEITQFNALLHATRNFPRMSWQRDVPNVVAFVTQQQRDLVVWHAMKPSVSPDPVTAAQPGLSRLPAGQTWGNLPSGAWTSVLLASADDSLVSRGRRTPYWSPLGRATYHGQVPSIYALRDQSAVLSAIKECDRLGRDTFLQRYGYKRARQYVLKHGGRDYDSKAILGVAFKYAFGDPLTPYDFSGGERTVWLVLTRMGFHVEGNTSLQVSPLAMKPTSDREKLEQRAVLLLEAAKKAKTRPPFPKGNLEPVRVGGSKGGFVRDPAVVAFVLSRADGQCEACGEAAPFRRANGLPFLEVHHVKHLAESGPDTHDNAVAVCPNCHRALHSASNRSARKLALYRALPALRKY